MDVSFILRKIIEEEGSCSWSRRSICDICPLSKLKKKPDGNWMSCIEAIGIEDMTEELADLRYKEVAARILLDETIDDILSKEPNGSQ